MIVYLNQYNSTIWHSKKYCEEDLDECFSESLGEVTEYDSAVLQNAYDLCEAAHDKDYVHAGQAMARLLQVYEDFRDEFFNNFYATVEGDEEEMKKELAALLEADYSWGDEECDAEEGEKK